MFALINGIFGRADRDGNHQLEIEEYWSTFKAFDLNGKLSPLYTANNIFRKLSKSVYDLSGSISCNKC